MSKASYLSIFFLVLMSGVAFAQSAPQPTEGELNRLASIRDAIEVLQENQEAGIITPAQYEAGVDRYLKKASAISPEHGNLQALRSLEHRVGVGAPQHLTALQRFAGLITFMNVIWILAILAGVGALTFLAVTYFKDLLAFFILIPAVLYEILFYGLSLALIGGGKFLQPSIAEYVGLTGVLLFGGAMVLSISTRELKPTPSRCFLLLTVVASAAALWHGSSLLGFVGVIALMATLGFFGEIIPGFGYVIGFKDDDALVRTTAAAFFVLILFCGIRMFGGFVPYLSVFEAGSLWMGSFVGFLGMLIMSSRWYEKGNYLMLQIVTIVLGLAALLVGSIWQIGELQKIGGTFFVLYVLEKPFEIPFENARAYAALTLVMSGIAYGFILLVKSRPETFHAFLPF